MRRILLTFLFGFICSVAGFSQFVDTVYTERFDPPSGPDSVSTYNTAPLLNSVWNDTTYLQVSGTHSYHTQIEPFDSVIFETDTFSTLNNVFVRLSFKHIAKIHFGQRGYIQASNDGGATWQNVTGGMYKGNSPQFGSLSYFNELSYPNPSNTPYWYGPTTSPSSAVQPTNGWWAEETFDVSSILGGINGYTTCKVRFIAKYQIQSPVQLAGWFIDDLMVEAAPCELDPPVFQYKNLAKKPVGARYLASEQVQVFAKDDASGVDSVLFFWRVNGGSWQNIEMTALTGGSCPDSSLYQYTVNNIALYDTVDWYIEVYDCACPNMTPDPPVTASPTYYTFWRDVAPPAICGTVYYPASFPLVITQLPWVENFDGPEWVAGTGSGATGTAHRGTWPTDNPPNGENWTVAPNATTTGFAWSIRTGGTATNNTGPDSDNTTGNGKYIYTEASQGNGSVNKKVTQAITPCIDLTAANCAALEFYYHMYGQHVDFIRVDVDTGTATSKWVNNIFRITGQQQNSGSKPYEKAFVSLEQFSGRIIRIRFIGRKSHTASNDKNDMAIDDIRVLEPTPVDVEMTDYSEPENGYCSYTSTEVVKGAMQSLGCVTLTEIPVAFKVERTPPSGSPITSVIERDTINGSFGLGSDTTFSFAPFANLSQYGTYKIWIWSEVPGDTIPSNDTVGPYIIEHNQPITGMPYIMDFDDTTYTPGNGTSGNPGVLANDDWERIPNPANGGYAWYVHNQKTPSMATGPREDYSGWGQGNYLYTEGDQGSAPVSAQLVSKCLDLTGLTNPQIDFMYHMYGGDIGALNVQIVPSGSNNWTNLPGGLINLTSQMHTKSKEQWKHHSVNLSSYANQVVKLRFVAQKTGSGNASDIAIDNIRIYSKTATDVGIMHISQPAQRMDTANALPPKFIIRNYGSSTVNNIPITYTITPRCGPNAGVPTSYNITYTGSVAAGAEYEFTAPSTPTYPPGTFDICATTNKSGDNNSFNNEFCRSSVGWTRMFIQSGFFEDFDDCADGVGSGFWSNGDYITFGHGDKQFSSAPRSYNTYEFNWNSYPNTEEHLDAPRFIGFDTIVGAQLWFKHKFQFGAGDVGLVEVNLPGQGWITLGFQDPDDEIGFNWFNGANLGAVNNGSGFVGNTATWQGNQNGWITSMWPLNIYNYSANPLTMRWLHVSAGGGSSGWAIDDVEVRIPPQNSASPIEIDTKEFPRFPNIPSTIQLRIQNTGAKRLDSCLAAFSVDGGPWSSPEKFVFDPKLIAGRKSKTLDFLQKWQNPTSGTHNVCVATWAPNSKRDNFEPDDTLCVSLKVLDEFVFTATDTQYCISFDDPAQVDWIESNTYNKKGLVSWEKGTPAQAPIIGAHSAPNAWMTKLSNNYKVRDSSSLYSTVFVTDSGGIFDIEFWHNYKTELYHDGGTVDISFDGLSWRTVGYVLPPDTVYQWYDIEHVTALNVIDPGWSGESGGWVKARIKVQFDQPRKSVLRFRFASDQSFEYQGWAIDDFCMTASTGTPQDFIGIDELNESALIDVGNIIPNPSNGSTKIPYYMDSPTDVKVSIYNMLGQQMMNFDQPSENGVNTINFDVTGWTPGLYVVTIDVNGERVTRKLMVK